MYLIAILPWKKIVPSCTLFWKLIHFSIFSNNKPCGDAAAHKKNFGIILTITFKAKKVPTILWPPHFSENIWWRGVYKNWQQTTILHEFIVSQVQMTLIKHTSWFKWTSIADWYKQMIRRKPVLFLFWNSFFFNIFQNIEWLNCLSLFSFSILLLVQAPVTRFLATCPGVGYPGHQYSGHGLRLSP